MGAPTGALSHDDIVKQIRPGPLIAAHTFVSGHSHRCLLIQQKTQSGLSRHRITYSGSPVFMSARFGMSVCESIGSTDMSHVRIERLILIHLEYKVTSQRMLQCIQPQHANPLEPWPQINRFKLTRADRNQSVYSACHPSFGKTCVFALSSEQRLNKHSLAYATYYCFSVFVSTNHLQIWPRLWAGCQKGLGSVVDNVVQEGGPGNRAQLPSPSPKLRRGRCLSCSSMRRPYGSNDCHN